MKVTEYCDACNLQLIVTYYPNQRGRWSADFDRCETKENFESSALTGTHGNGNSPSEAITDYVRKIRGKILVRDAMRETRHEYVVPDHLGGVE